jgi:hypothetical protein
VLRESNMHSWKFTDEEGELCEAYYSAMSDDFAVWRVSSVNEYGVTKEHFSYSCDEVEDYLNRGIWKRIS